MDEAILIRPARDEDVVGLEELIPMAVRDLSKGFYTPRQIDSAIAHVFGVDRQLIADGTYFVAEANGGRRLVGCGGWSRRKTMFGGDRTAFKEANDELLDPARDAARLRAFFVHPAFSRRGIGRTIVRMCEQAARDAGFTSMDLVATLPGAPLYAACGYRSVERFDIDIPGGIAVPAIKMHKSLVNAPTSSTPEAAGRSR
jgi:GNAT superfamily N-acetyltransferase